MFPRVNGTTFVWNDDKARLNVRNHGAAFEQAAEVFFDPFFRLVDAGRNDEALDAVIGYDSGSRLLCVVHVEIEGEIVRIISARKATSRERETYDS
ncbi:MAG: BrnT family toxin [Rhodanobacteraceae bacterium]|nr:BrnT family toxin [Rhodanobacteraceae bacterium]